MGKGDRIGIMLDMNPGIIEIFSDGNDIPGEGAIRHVAFAPKLRGKEIYGKLKKDIGQILRKLCEQKDVQIIEAEACPDHIHMLVIIPPHTSIAQFMGYLKGKSTLMIFDRHANLRYKYSSRSFWCRGTM